MVPGDRTRLHHFRAETGEFEHFVVGNFIELARAGHDARVGGIDAVHVGVNLAEVGLQCRCQRDRGQVRAAAAKRRDLAIGCFTLETGDDDHVAVVEVSMNLLGRDVLNLGLGVNAVSQDASLRTGERNGLHAERVQRHRGERNRGLFAGGQEHVHLALAGHAAHRRDDHDDLVAFAAIPRDARRDIFDSPGVADRSTPVFLND